MNRNFQLGPNGNYIGLDLEIGVQLYELLLNEHKLRPKFPSLVFHPNFKNNWMMADDIWIYHVYASVRLRQEALCSWVVRPSVHPGVRPSVCPSGLHCFWNRRVRQDQVQLKKIRHDGHMVFLTNTHFEGFFFI